MADPARLVESALRCYPARWRNRHGAEAAEVARLLMRDGKPARSIVWSYLRGAACERLRLTWRPGPAVTMLTLAAGSLSISLAILPSTTPAGAANLSRTPPAPTATARPSCRPAPVFHGDTGPEPHARSTGVQAGEASERRRNQCERQA